MADYRAHYEEIRAAGAHLAALSVDAPEKSEALRRELRLPFVVLCDTERRVVREWDLYNPRERGGIAKPSVFLIDQNRTVRYAAVDSLSSRVPASEIVRLLKTEAADRTARRKRYIPGVRECLRAIRSNFQR